MTIIDDIKARVDLIDLIQEDAKVRLRRAGKNWSGFCPFHSNSHTPALVVFPDTHTWHCYGSCNDGGSVIDWVLKKNPGWDVKEAIRNLAQRANIPLGEMDGPELKQRLAIRAREDAMQIAARLFAKWLQEDQEALAYARSRGWSDETIVASRLGFSGRATAAQVKEMKGEFDLHGIKHDSPDAVMILGYQGDVASWAKLHGLDPAGFKEKRVHGLMDKPGLVYAHRIDGRIAYLSRRQLPGHDVIKHGDGTEQEWKSFNPYASLAGDKVPFFNHMHLRDRGRIVIVEGQGDAVTLAQWGIPAMALNGSQWKSLEDVIKVLRDKYETIYFATDADTPGETIITGPKNDFPLTTAFGPMLWVARWPKFKWIHNEHEKICKDANDLAQYHLDEKIEEKAQQDNVRRVFDQAEPIVLLAAKYAGRQQGPDRQKALDFVLPLIAKMSRNSLNDMRLKLAKAIYPEDLFPEYKGAPIRPFQKLIGDELKNRDDDAEPVELEETIGGWYPVNEDGSEGYLLEMLYEKQTGKAKFAYAHIWIETRMNGHVHVTSKREISTANFIDINGKRYVPMMDDNIRFGTVRLPNALGEKKTTRQLVGEIRLFLARYFLLDNDIHQIQAALYALFTWVYDAFPYLPYLRARGAPGTGKSELMLLVGRVCYRMMTTAGLTTIAGFKGMAHIYGGTLFIDEVDSLASQKEDRGELRALLNVRAMKEQARIVTMVDVLKADGTHTFRPATTNVFGPTLLTMYGAFKDPATESRCLTFDLFRRDVVELQRHHPPIEPGVIPPSLEIEADQLRNDLLTWRLHTWLPRIEAPENVMLTDPRVSARMNQVMRPLKVLAYMQDDKDLLRDLEMIAEVNYEEEMKKMAESFEALIFRAVVAVDEREEYAKYVQRGKLGRQGEVRYVLARDLAVVANEIADIENYGEGSADDKKKDAIKARTITSVCRDGFRLPIERAGSHKGVAAIVLDKEKIEIGKFRFGMDQVELEDTPAKPNKLELFNE